MKARKLIFEVKEEHEQIRMRRRVVVPGDGTICSECEVEVGWLTIPDASRMLRVRPEGLLEILASDRLHFRVKRGGGVLICANSISDLTNDPSLPGESSLEEAQ